MKMITGIKTQIAQAPKAQEPQEMKAIRHEIHMSMLDLKHLKQGKDGEQKSTYSTRHGKHQKKKAQDRLVTRVHKTCEAWKHISYEAREAREHLGQEAQMYVRDQARAVPKNARDMAGEVQEYVRHVRHDST